MKLNQVVMLFSRKFYEKKMICPKCGYVDKTVPVPEITRNVTKLGVCKKCAQIIFCVPSQKKSETNKVVTVIHGEIREAHLVEVYLKYEQGNKSSKRPLASDIDRDILDEKDNVIYHWEIKERSNTINAYRETQFPYAKIDEGKRLLRETGKPVYIVLKFADCWARITIDLAKEYKKGDRPFAPAYRPSQMNSERQIPAQIPVEELEILNIRDECKEERDINLI